MSDSDDYMQPKTVGNTITELMWDRLQEGINANRRFRLKGVAGGDNMRYNATKVVWDSDIYIYFTRELDGAWVYNKINSNPTTGITCNNDDLLYVILNDTSATVLTVSLADYTAMPTDDTGRILILGAVRGGRWYGIASTDLDHTKLLSIGNNTHTQIDSHISSVANPHAVEWSDVSSGHTGAAHSGVSVTNLSDVTGVGSGIIISAAERSGLHAQSHDNTYHTTNYEVANANIQSHVGTPPADSHHAKYALTEDLTSQEITQLQNIGEVTTISAGQWGIVGGLLAVGSGTIISAAERTALHAIYVHPTTSGNIHLPAAGATNQLLQYASAGTASWITLGGDVSLSGATATVAASHAGSSHHTKYALTDDLAAGEITQLQNINLITITNIQWGYLGALTESPQTHMSAANPHSGSAPSAHSHLDAEVDNGITLTNITQITTRSHTSLSDVGSNAHSVIDTHLGASNPHSGSEPTITYGIAAGNVMKAEGVPVDNDYAKFTVTGLEGRSYTEVLSDIGAAASGHGHGQLHDRSHVFTSTSDHTASGLTAGYVIRASAPTTFAWAQLAHSDLNDDESTQHFIQSAITTVGTLTVGNVSARDSVGLIASKTSGDLFYWTTALQRLAKAIDGDVMTLASGLPSWQTPGAPGAHASSHEIAGGDLVDHDNLTNFVANEHKLESAMSLASLGTRNHASLSDAPTDAHHAQNHASRHHSGGGDLLAHQSIPGAGSNTHPTIDTHLGATNPHSGHVDTSGNETIAGVKTFSSIPVLPSSNPTLDDQATRKSYVDSHMQTGRWWVGGNTFVGNLATMLSDGIRTYENSASSLWYAGYLPLPQFVTIAGVTKYLRITSCKIAWWQNIAGDNLTRLSIKKHRIDTLSGLTVINDVTTRGGAGNNTYTWSLSTNNTLDATYGVFGLLIYYTKVAAADFRLVGAEFIYGYV